MASRGTIKINVDACDGSGFGVGILTSPPSHGTASVDNNNNVVTYTNNGDGITSDRFVFTDDDGAPVNVYVAIGAGTVAAPISGPIDVVVGYGSSDNPVDLKLRGGTATSISLVGGPGHGTVKVVGTSVTYAPAADYAGPDSFAYTASNSGGTSAPATVTVTVSAPTIELSPAQLADGVAGLDYSQSFSSSGGTGPYTYEVTAGALPAGITLSGSTLTGRSAQAGDFPVTITTTDSTRGTGPFSASRPYTLHVSGPTITIGPASLPDGTVGATYTATVTAAGGTEPYTFVASALPPGITIGTSGAITGKPTTAGTFHPEVTVTDTNGFTATHAYTIEIAGIAPQPPTGVSAVVVDASAGTAQVSFTPPTDTGGLPVTGYTVTSNTGSLTASGNDSPLVVPGLVAGTEYTFTVTATNTAGRSRASSPSNAVQILREQTITFAQPGTQEFGTSPTLKATASSGLSVVFRSDTDGVCTVTPSGTLTFVSTGTCTVDATQSGDATFNPAPAVTRSFMVQAALPATPTIGKATAGDAQASVTFSAPANDGGAPITGYIVTSHPGDIAAGGNGSPIAVDGLTNGTAYTFTVRATNSRGSGNASAASNSVTPKGSQSIAFDDPGQVDFGSSTQMGATASSGLPIVYSSATTNVCTVGDSGVLKAVAPGSCTVHADQPGNDAYLPARRVSHTFPVVVAGGAVSIATASLPSGTAGQHYSQTITAVGGAVPYTFTLASGTLPAGVALSPAGVVSGTPTKAGTFDVGVRVSDAAGQVADRTLPLHIDAPEVTVGPASVPRATGGVAYSQPLTATGGTEPYTYAVTAGSLPAGLSLSPAGMLTGTPTAAGASSVTVTATDQLGFKGSQAYTITVDAPGLVISPASLPGATAGSVYKQSLTASGGTAPYTYAVTAGSLPAGLALSDAGVLGGTPTVSGSFDVTLTAKDRFGFEVSQPYTLQVGAPTLTLAPGNLPGGQVGKPYAQTVTASGGTGTYTYTMAGGALPPGLSLGRTGSLSGIPTAAGNFNVSIKATDALGFDVEHAYTIGIDQPVPVAVDDTASTKANTAVSIDVTANDSGPITSVAVVQQPAHGTATANGTRIAYVPATNYYGSDTLTYTATGPGGTSAAADVKLTVNAAEVPVPAPHTATVLGGQTVTIDATEGASNGPYTSVAIVNPPASGKAVVQGTDIVYTADAAGSGDIGFDYTLSNAFGASRPAHVTVTVNAVPVAPPLVAAAISGRTVRVDLTAGARGGPFTGATVVSVTPAEAGATAIEAVAGGYVLTFTAAPAFGGTAQVTYTLRNAYATSAPGSIAIAVTPRSDPSKDAEVLGVLDAQADATRRMATAQITNFQRRLERLHDGALSGGMDNGITFTSASGREDDRMSRRGIGAADSAARQPGMDAADARTTGSTTGTNGATGFWTAGAVNFGATRPGMSQDGVDFTTSGISAGADRRINERLAVGLGLGYGHDNSDVGRNGSHSKVDSYNVAGYASFKPGASTYVDALVGYQKLSYDARRYVTDNGNLVAGERDGRQVFASVAFGYEHTNDGMLFSPYARYDMAHAQLDGYTERGDDIYALRYHRQTVDTSTGNLGVRLGWSARRDYGVWSPELRAEYQHDFQGGSPVWMNYADLSSGPLYRASLQDQSGSRTMVGASIQLQTLGGWLFRFEYQNLLENSARDNQSILFGVERSLPP